MPDRIGYARTNSSDQSIDLQLSMLTAAGCTRIFQDKALGIQESRPEWDKLLDYVRSGDTVVVYELSRMARSFLHLLKLVQVFDSRGISIACLRENIDTSTDGGRTFLSVLGAIDQMERDLKAERAAAGGKVAKPRGRSGGRPSIPDETLKNAALVYQNSTKTAVEVCKMFGIGRRTLFDYMRKKKLKE